MRLPLEGIRVTAITAIMAGPVAGRWFSDWGAELIEVEPPHMLMPLTRGSIDRPDPSRAREILGFGTWNKLGIETSKRP